MRLGSVVRQQKEETWGSVMIAAGWVLGFAKAQVGSQNPDAMGHMRTGKRALGTKARSRNRNRACQHEPQGRQTSPAPESAAPAQNRSRPIRKTLADAIVFLLDFPILRDLYPKIGLVQSEDVSKVVLILGRHFT